MSEIVVDTERLARNLECGLGKIDHFMSASPARLRLRNGFCGLVSTAIHEHLKERDVSSELKIISPNFTFDQNMQHVVPILDANSDDPFLIDATYSQFYEYVGLRVGYEYFSKHRVYPNEKIMALRQSELEPFIGKMALFAANFKNINIHPKSPFGNDLGDGPLKDASIEEIEVVYGQLWDINKYKPWVPTDDRQNEEAIKLASFISERCIKVS